MTSKSSSLTRRIVSGSLGNLLEWYDFSLYGYFATIIGTLFFPAENPGTALIFTFMIFAVGLLMRPIGGVVLGHLGDKLGRKTALVISIIIVTVPTFAMGLLPTYAQIGLAATVLLLLLRILQGLAVGGEFIGTILFTIEHAPMRRRGLIGSLAYMGQTGGMIGSALAATVVSFLPPEQLYSYGWRLPFLLGVIVGAVGLYIRLKVSESSPFLLLKKRKALPIREVFHHHLRKALTIFGVIVFQSIGFYTLLLYMVTWLTNEMQLPITSALGLTIVNMLVFTILNPIAGWLSDRIGRKPLLITGCVGAIIFTLPLFWLLSLSPNSSAPFTTAVFPFCGFSLILACFHGPLASFLVEFAPNKVRYSTLALGYNFSAAICGGTAPLVATYLIHKTHWAFSPCIYVMIAAAITLCVLLFFVKETYKNSLTQEN